MFMTLNTDLFPSEMMSSIHHADNEMNEMKDSIQYLKNQTTSDEIFQNMLVSSLSSVNPISIVLWTLAALSFAGYLFFFCWYCNALRHRRSSNRRLRHRNRRDDNEVGLPLNDIEHPAPMDGEDEIAYIARTGNVRHSGSIRAANLLGQP
jgi:hypothetical protein